jgi:replicative DNA helicase
VRESLASQERREAGETGIHTGFVELDDMLGGMRPGQLLIVAARPSMGKTAFALDLLRHAGVMQDQPVAMFSLEMSTEELGGRMACKQAGVNNYAYQRCTLDAQAMSEVQMASVTLGEAPVHIDDTAGISIMRLRARARRLAARHGIKLIVVDYLQLVTAPDYRQRREEVGAVSRGLKAIAKELGVPVVCLSQLNRQAESRDKHRPRMADLKESGDIEQDADVVMLLHREDYYHQDDPDWTPTRRGEVIVAKQRNGATGTVELAWDGPTMTFRNL